MSDTTMKAAHRIQERVSEFYAGRNAEYDDRQIAEIVRQAADEKYRPLVEAVELYIKANDSHDCAERYNQLREALRKVKEG